MKGKLLLVACSVLLSAIMPLPCWADIPPEPPEPSWQTNLHRIGFEILPTNQTQALKESRFTPSKIFLLAEKQFMDIESKIKAVKEELQGRFDLEYAKMDKAGQLAKIGWPSCFCGSLGCQACKTYHANVDDVAFKNAQRVIESVLSQDKALYNRCLGVPIEMLTDAMERPNPAIDPKAAINEKAALDAFRQWAEHWDLNDYAGKRLFEWQFYVVQHEKRPWREYMTKYGYERVRDKDFKDIRDGSSSFSEIRLTNSVALIEAWYKKAVKAGMTPSADDQEFMTAIEPIKKLRNSNVDMYINSRTPKGVLAVTIRRSTTKTDLGIVHDIVMRKDALRKILLPNFAYVLAELIRPDNQTLRRVREAFSEDDIAQCEIFGDGVSELDLSLLGKCRRMKRIKLKNCRVRCAAALSGCPDLEEFFALNSTLGDLSFLAPCNQLSQLWMTDCSFSGFEHLGTKPKLCMLTMTGARETIDLSNVRELEHLRWLCIDGCTVTNFTALAALQHLGILSMKHLKGDVNSMTFLTDCCVFFNKEDLKPAVYLEYEKKEQERWERRKGKEIKAP